MQRFSEIVGHADRVRDLRADLVGGQRSSTYLLVGRAGVGKRTLASIFAAALLCERGGDEGACGVCDSCRCLRAGNHPDFEVVDPGASKRGRIELKDVREQIIGHLGLAPRRGRGRAMLVESAERLSIEAQQALLKTLEEPPAGSTLMLVAESETGLLDTVLSRCRILRFGRLSNAQCRLVLERSGAAEEGLDAAIALGDGSPGEALAWLANPLFTERDRIASWILEKAPESAEMRDILPGLDPTGVSQRDLMERRAQMMSLLSLTAAILGVLLRSAAQVVPSSAMPYDLRGWDVERFHPLCRIWFEVTREAMEDLERMVAPELVFEIWVNRLPR